ncbi:tumor necrosis factor receptor superfamily member 13C [Dipodomys merriami]|uniref:tumor necrosis factor receptor superfamily member 13C n=1 Tax=Dipodomys merriami TaxID=94247 RepID=UPI00385604F2
MGREQRAARGRPGRDGAMPASCARAHCFDLLLRRCVDCKLLRTAEPGRDPRPSRPASPSPRPAAVAGSSLAPGTALQPRGAGGAGGAGPGREAAPPLPALLLGAPVLLGLALALALVALVSWKWRRRRRTASAEAPDGGPDELLDDVLIPTKESQAASAPAWPPPGEEPDVPAAGHSVPVPATAAGHSVPVPATELGSTELVTTKTAGPEQQ